MQRHVGRVEGELTRFKCDICTAQYKLFNFSVNKFISGEHKQPGYYDETEPDPSLHTV